VAGSRHRARPDDGDDQDADPALSHGARLVRDDDEERREPDGEAELAEDQHDGDADEDGRGTGEPSTGVDSVAVEREDLSQSVVHVDSFALAAADTPYL
jgi:hypothetical protein